ncbi:hypothetical protein apy_05650, partial [Aeropyrum pernix]
PAVPLAVPIVASGCLPCMIQSGGLANLVGPPDAPVDMETVAMLSHADPLSYIRMAGERGWLEGKAFYILFSGHDEYFPTEGLAATVDALRSAGAVVAVAYSGNNNHYKPAPGWMDSALLVLEEFRDGGVEAVRTLLTPAAGEEAGWPDLLAGGAEWRPSSDGLAYLPGIPLIPLVLSGEVVSRAPGEVLATSLPWSPPRILPAIILLAATVLAGLHAHRSRLPRWPAALAAAYATAAAYTIAFWTWPGRFSLGMLSLMERFAVTPSLTLGLPTLELMTLSAALSPLLAAAYLLAAGRWVSIATAALYLAVALPPYIVMRLVLSLVAENALQPIPAAIVPVEIAYILILAAAVVAKRVSGRREEGEAQAI